MVAVRSQSSEATRHIGHGEGVPTPLLPPREAGVRDWQGEQSADGSRFSGFLIGYRTKSGARAVCLDLGLVVERPTLPEAIVELHLLVDDYLTDAAKSGHFDEMVPRPAPSRTYVHTYLRFGWAVAQEVGHAMWNRIRMRSNVGQEPRFVATPC